jgi:hypothetical protein
MGNISRSHTVIIHDMRFIVPSNNQSVSQNGMDLAQELDDDHNDFLCGCSSWKDPSNQKKTRITKQRPRGDKKANEALRPLGSTTRCVGFG